MNRIFTFLLIAVLPACYSHAQLTLGARVGLNFTSFTGKWDGQNASNKTLPGLQAGLVGDYALNRAFSVQPALIVTTQGSRIKEDGSTMKSRINYLQAPVNALYKFDLDGPNFFVQVGPYLGYAISGNYKIKNEGVSGKEKISFGRGDDDVKRFDLGVGAGIGLEYSNIQVAIGYNTGLMNLDNVKGYNTKNKGLWLVINYFFL